MRRRLQIPRSAAFQAGLLGVGAFLLRCDVPWSPCHAVAFLNAATRAVRQGVPLRAYSLATKPTLSAPLAVKPEARRKTFPDAVAVEVTINGLTFHILEASIEWQERMIEEAVEAPEESTEADPYGMAIWPSAQVVAQAATAHVAPLLEAALQRQRYKYWRPKRKEVKRPRVLELGAGCGLASLALAAHGVDVLATDFRALPLQLLNESARLQGFESTLSTQLFDICDESVRLPKADVVIAADLLYERRTAVALARRVVEARERGSTVLIGDVGRPNSKAFLDELMRLRPQEPTGFWFYGTAVQKKREGIASGGSALQNEKRTRVDVMELPLGPARMAVHPARPSVVIRPRGHDHVL